MGRKRTIEYPDWVEKYRKPGCTIRKTRNGYGLYRCTSKRQEDGSSRIVQEYLGMVTQEDGFIPKRGAQAPVRLEHGLSHLIWVNYARELSRFSYQGGKDLIKLGIIQFIFGRVTDERLCSSSLTFQDHEELSRLAGRVSPERIRRMEEHIGRLLRKDIPDDADYRMVTYGLSASQAEAAPGGMRKSPVPDDIKELLERYHLKY